MDKQDGNASRDEIKNGKIYAFCSYLSLLCLIPLFFKRDNQFVLFHAKQGIVLCGLEIILCFFKFFPVIGEVLFIFGMVICGIFSLSGMIKVIMNEFWEMPVLFDIAEKINL